MYIATVLADLQNLEKRTLDLLKDRIADAISCRLLQIVLTSYRLVKGSRPSMMDMMEDKLPVA
ncbi:MAG: hypothetical protein ACRD1R_04945 [Acidobacteriota bacterium]